MPISNERTLLIAAQAAALATLSLGILLIACGPVEPLGDTGGDEVSTDTTSDSSSTDASESGSSAGDSDSTDESELDSDSDLTDDEIGDPTETDDGFDTLSEVCCCCTTRTLCQPWPVQPWPTGSAACDEYQAAAKCPDSGWEPECTFVDGVTSCAC